MSLNEKEIGQVAEFIRTLKSVERDEFRQYLIEIEIQYLDFGFE